MRSFLKDLLEGVVEMDKKEEMGDVERTKPNPFRVLTVLPRE